jgi:hypothetical protein
MSGTTGIVSGMNYGLLFSGSSSSTNNIAADMISTLYSTASSSGSTFASTGSPLLDLKLAQQDQTTDVAQEALQPQVSQAINAFKTAVADAPNIQTALLNPDVQKVLLTANGLSSYIGQTALVQKMFLSNPSDTKSLVNQIGDNNFLSAVQTFDFAKNGRAELQNPKIVATLTNGYAEVTWRQSLDQAAPGLSNAQTFLSQPSSIKSVDDILGNQTNFDVVTTALGLPQQIVNQTQTAIDAAIGSRLDISKLQDPKFVTTLTDQYLLTMQSANSSSSSGTSLTALAVQAAGLVV